MTAVPKKPKARLLGRRTQPRERPPAPRRRRCRRLRVPSRPSRAVKPTAKRSRARRVRTMRRVARHDGRSERLLWRRTSRARRNAWHRGPLGCGAPTTRAAAIRTRPAMRMASAGRPAAMRQPQGDPARALRVRVRVRAPARPAMTTARARPRAAVARPRAAAAAAAVRPRTEALRPHSGPPQWTAIQRLTSRLSARRSRSWKTSALGRSALRIESGGFQVWAK